LRTPSRDARAEHRGGQKGTERCESHGYLAAVVARYEQRLGLSLTDAERRDLVGYLRSL
jgi:hypothetical protein